MSMQPPTEKTLSLPMLAGCVLIYLLIVQGVALLLVADQNYTYATFPTTGSILRSTTIPVTLALMFVAVLVSWLGWWKKVLNESMTLPRWTWLVPVVLLLSIMIVTNYAQLSVVTPDMVLVLVFSVCLVGMAEELMFRGIVLKSLRDIGLSSEFKVALWTALIFGGVHITNIFTEGPAAFFQVINASASGLLFYIVLRVSGTLILPMILHAAWDFSLFSWRIGENPETSIISGIALITTLVLAVIIIIKRHTVWPLSGSAVGR